MVINKHIIAAYKKVYDLPELEYEEQVPDGFFKLYNKKHYFTIISIYNSENEHLLIRDFNKNIGWELPGGYINDRESIEDAVNRITLHETGLEIDELYPVAIVKNIFRDGNNVATHFGVAFMALSRGETKSYPRNIKTHFTRHIPDKVAYQNDKILDLVREKLNLKHYSPPFAEIDSIKKKKFAPLYFFHRHIIKPIGSLSSKKIKNEIFKLIEGNPKTILDASCGDSSIINNLCERYKPDVCIGNDISWKSISLMQHKNSKVIFTNHNVLTLPYKMKFDLVIFKNTLHHIEKKYHLKVLRDLQKLAKQLIVVDINDPQHSSLRAKLWNNYYVYLLGDQGDSFVKLQEFKKNLEKDKINGQLKTGLINTIKGKYFYITIKS